MAKIEVHLQQKEKTVLYGVWGKSNDRTIAKDIPLLSSEFYKMTKTQEGMVLPFFVLSRNYDTSTGSSELFIGSLLSNDELSELELPDGTYAVITVKPKFGIFGGGCFRRSKTLFLYKMATAE